MQRARSLFDPDGIFHSREYRRKLAELAREATDDKAVQLNFLRYLRLLIHGASGGIRLSPSNCTTILEDKRYTRMLWRAAVAQRLNLRTMGSLRQERERLVARFGYGESDVRRPKWWRRMEQESFRK